MQMPRKTAEQLLYYKSFYSHGTRANNWPFRVTTVDVWCLSILDGELSQLMTCKKPLPLSNLQLCKHLKYTAEWRETLAHHYLTKEILRSMVDAVMHNR